MATQSTTDYTWLRQKLLQKRQALTLSQRQADSQRLCLRLWDFIQQHFNTTHTIAAFWPIGAEVDIRPVLTQLDEAQYSVLLPKVVEKNAPLRFFRWSHTYPMVLGHFNIPEPQADEEVTTMPDLVLTPLLGFTAQGDRLGYGKGYYDRTLNQWISQGLKPYAIGLGWDEGLIEDTDYQPAVHDVPLANILTPSGWVL
ncbi:5-formyltetrahydrofolate cyclo-ligase [Pelistega europaea]|uniref:5-formyltetrahydrofolate cyclo-ligase n=1 Tax=Pelistega europaea TaxID=106147 RepID=A0A7Y4P4B0_9BURK|nr:5-formyltetrahydrofolate cyclo-ligase [Pelistega europaea]NOL49306.1 5-formyltetrahydrofolate cyclo-ligase [Pelistega europaea]